MYVLLFSNKRDSHSGTSASSSVGVWDLKFRISTSSFVCVSQTFSLGSLGISIDGCDFKSFFKISWTVDFERFSKAARLRIESWGFSLKLFATRSMFSKVFEDGLGPDRGLFKIAPVLRNFCTHEKIKETLGPSLNRRMSYREQNFRRAVTHELLPLKYASRANARCSADHCDIVTDESARFVTLTNASTPPPHRYILLKYSNFKT